jgi:hypothetical protein
MKNKRYIILEFIGIIIINILLLIGCEQSITSDIENTETLENDLGQQPITRAGRGVSIEINRSGINGEEIIIRFDEPLGMTDVSEIRLDNIDKKTPIIWRYSAGKKHGEERINLSYGKYRLTLTGGEGLKKVTYVRYFKYTDVGFEDYNGAKECRHDYNRFYNNEKNTITINNGSGLATFKLWTFNRFVLYIKKIDISSDSEKYYLINAPQEPAFIATEYSVSLPGYIKNKQQQKYEIRLYACDCFEDLYGIIRENSEFKCDHYFKSELPLDIIFNNFPITYNLKFREVKSK